MRGGVELIQRSVVLFAGRGVGGGGEDGVQGLKTSDGNPAPPAACALEIPQLQLREGALLRAKE